MIGRWWSLSVSGHNTSQLDYRFKLDNDGGRPFSPLDNDRLSHGTVDDSKGGEIIEFGLNCVLKSTQGNHFNYTEKLNDLGLMKRS